MDIIYSLLRFLGWLSEPAPLRKNFKRNRVHDDFSSDDETPVPGHNQVKRFRGSDIIDITDNCDKDDKHSNSVRNVPVQVKGSYTTSTPNESPSRTVPLGLLSSRNGPTTPIERTTRVNPVIDVEVIVQQKEPTVKKTQKKPSIVDVDLDEDDSDDNQQDNDVVFVKEVISPPASPHNHYLAESNHAQALNYEVLPKTSEELKPEVKLDYQNLLWGIAKTNIHKPMSKRKPERDGKLADATSPQKIQVHKLNEIKLNGELNAGRQQNATKEDGPSRVCLSDSSDSDVEEVPQVFSTMSSVKKDLERKAFNLLLELDSQYNEVQTTVGNINDARPISVTSTSKVNSDQNVACSSSAEETEKSDVLLPNLGSEYNVKQLHNKPETPQWQEHLNDSRRTADFAPNGNSEQNEASSSGPDNINDWLAILDAKYFSTPKPPEKLCDVESNRAQSSKPHITKDWLSKLASKYETDQLKSQEKLRETVQESDVVSKVNTDLDTTREWLASLEAEYFASPPKTQENLSNARHFSDIVPNVNDERKDVFTVESEYEKVLPKTQDQTDGALQESDILKKSETNEARSYLPADALDWLSKLDAEYKTASQKQEDLSKARQALRNASKVNVNPIEHGSGKPSSVNHGRGELRSRYNAEQHDPNTTFKSETVSKVNSEKDKAQSHILETARKRLSALNSTQKTEESKTQIIRDDTYQEVTNLPNVKNGRNVPLSFKFNTSEDLMMKLGSLYKSYQQEAHENSNNSSEQKHKQGNSEGEDMEFQSNVDFDLPALTPEQEKLVENGLEQEPEDELLVEKFNMRIHRRDLQTLADENWLNDEVINFYMNLIMQRSEEREDLPKVYATNTFFYTKLMTSGQAGLRRWTRKVDIFAYDLFVVPINIGRHWCLSLVDFRARVIKYLDSQGQPNPEGLKAIQKYLNDEHQDKKGAPFNSKGWKAAHLTGIPQQMNGSDCGMFACTFAEFSARDAAYSFTQAHMPYLRRKAALEILIGKLLL